MFTEKQVHPQELVYLFDPEEDEETTDTSEEDECEWFEEDGGC